MLGVAALLLAALLSSGVAYTLQIIGQRLLQPMLASLLMSLESFFASGGGCGAFRRYRPSEKEREPC